MDGVSYDVLFVCLNKKTQKIDSSETINDVSAEKATPFFVKDKLPFQKGTKKVIGQP